MAEAAHEFRTPVPVGAAKLNVFISYSRDDLDFADQLDVTLGLHGFATTIDRHGISGGEDWKVRLGNLLRDADTVAFVLSPSSARSEICAWEVKEAVRLGKRIIPVLCRPLEGASPPPQLANLNYTFFYSEPKSPGSGFGTGQARLVAALNTDLDWLREHTRYLQRATEWDTGGRPANRLLSGADIATAKAWAARRPKEAPEPTALHLDFIRASEAEQGRQQSAEAQRLQQMAETVAARETAVRTAQLAQRDKEEAQRREVEQAKRDSRRIRAWLAAAVVLAAVAGGFGFYAFQQQRVAVAQSQVAQQALRVAIAWEYTEKEPNVSAAFLREAKRPASIRGWRGATSKTLEMLKVSSKVALQGHDDKILSAKFSPDGNQIVTASDDKTARIWDGKTGTVIAVLKGHDFIVNIAAFTPDGARIVTASADRTVRLWDAKTGAIIAVLMGDTEEVTSAASSPDRATILTTAGGIAKLWESATGKLIRQIKGHDGFISSAAFSHDGRRILTASDDQTARLWDAETGAEFAVLKGHSDRLSSASFSPDGRRIITASFDGTVRLWDGETGILIALLRGHRSFVTSAAFSPDGVRIVTASDDHRARLWEAATGKLIVVLQHSGAVRTASFSPDGRYVATASEDGRARLWTPHGLLDLVFSVSGNGLISVSYSPDGSRLVAVSQNGVAEILELLPKIESLVAQLWKVSAKCPGAQIRKDLLGYSQEEAEGEHQACEAQLQKLK